MSFKQKDFSSPSLCRSGDYAKLPNRHKAFFFVDLSVWVGRAPCTHVGECCASRASARGAWGVGRARA
eukprot:scaffold13557_cov63-Phaeocystis_antarctica.AAC.3